MTDDEHRLFLHSLLRERQTGMPRWRPDRFVAFDDEFGTVVIDLSNTDADTDSEITIAHRRKVLDDYRTSTEEVS